MATDTDSKPVDELIVTSSCKPAYSGERPSVPVNDYLESFNRIVTPVWVFDTDQSRVCWANQAALKMWRTESIEELAARDMGNEMSPTVAQRLEQYQQDFGNGASFTELWTLYPNGEPSTMRCIFSGIELDDGRMAMFCQGIEERPDTPDTLRSAQALLHTTVMISLYDLEGKTLYNNPAARAAQGDVNAGLEQRFVDPHEFDSLQHMLRRDAMASLVARIKTVHGPRWHEINARQSLDAVTGSPAVLISEVDVSDLKETERKAQYLAVHDTLTGLPNRTYMQNELLLHLEKARTDDLKARAPVHRSRQLQNDQRHARTRGRRPVADRGRGTPENSFEARATSSPGSAATSSSSFCTACKAKRACWQRWNGCTRCWPTRSISASMLF